MATNRNIQELYGGGVPAIARTEWPIKRTVTSAATGDLFKEALNPTLPFVTLYGTLVANTAATSYLLKSALIFLHNGRVVAEVPLEVKRTSGGSPTDLVVSAFVSTSAPSGPDNVVMESVLSRLYCSPHRLFCHADQVVWRVAQNKASSTVVWEMSLAVRQSNVP